MGRVLDLYRKTYAEEEAVYEEKFKCHKESWEQYQRLQIFYANELKELGSKRAAVAFRYCAIEAVHSVREQERQAQLKATSAITEKKLQEKYADTLAKLRDECNFQLQQCGALQQQLQQVHNLQRQMKEHYGKEAQRCLDQVAAEAARREAQLIASIQAGTVEPVLKQQLEQALIAAERAQQEVENWKGNSIFWEDKATQAEENI